LACGQRVDLEKGHFGIIIRALGSGSSGDVYHVELFAKEPCFCGLFSKAVSAGRCALKQVKGCDAAGAEIMIYQKLNQKQQSNFLTLFFHYKIAEDFYWLGLTFFEAPNLRTLLKESRLSAMEIMHIVSQSIAALEHLERLQIVHADIKPENILWSRTVRQLKLVDFGSASTIDMDHPKLVCTGPYRAPSILFEQPYSFEADRWALGCVIYELPTSGDKPLFELDIAQRIEALREEAGLHPEKDMELRKEAQAICDYDDERTRQELAMRFCVVIGKEAPPRYRLHPTYPKGPVPSQGVKLDDHFINEYLLRKPPFSTLTQRECAALKLSAELVRRFVDWDPAPLRNVTKEVQDQFCKCYSL